MLSGNLEINFGQQSSTCPSLSSGGVPPTGVEPWQQAVICGEGVTHFRADIGQSGGKKGYEGIVGKMKFSIISGLTFVSLEAKRDIKRL